MTPKTKAIKARSESLASAKPSRCNAKGVCFMGSPEGPGLARPGREPSNSVNRHWPNG